MKKLSCILILIGALGLGNRLEAAPVIQVIGLEAASRIGVSPVKVVILIESDAVINRVTLAGKAQKIIASKRVILYRDLQLKEGNNLLIVEARDVKGAKSSKQYDIAHYPSKFKQVGWIPNLKIEGYYLGLGTYYDSNPGLDLSGPGWDGVTEKQEQADFQSFATVATHWGLWGFTGDLGYQKSSYLSKHPDLGRDRIFFNAEQTYEQGDGIAWVLGYGFWDENQGKRPDSGLGYDLLQRHRFVAGKRYLSQDALGNRETTMFSGQVDLIDFASPNKMDGVDLGLKWDYLKTIPSKRRSKSVVVATGTRTEGILSSEYAYLGGDFTWAEQMEEDFKYSLNFDLELRDRKSVV